MTGGQLTIKITAPEIKAIVDTAIAAHIDTIDAYAVRQQCPDYIIEALKQWHEGLADHLPLPTEQAELADKVHHWLYGDEADDVH